MSQTERIYWIDDQIRRGRYPNADSVCAHFGVSRRTAYLDRDYLKGRLHAPLVFDHVRNGWAYSNTSYVLPYLAFTDKEAAALRRSLLAAQEFLPLGDAAPLQLVAERLTSGASQTPAAPEIVLGAIHLTAAAIPPDRLLADFRRAVSDRHRVRVLYYSAHRNETTERAVLPYHLLNWRGEHHLIAWCELRNDFRQFFLGRVREWEVLEPPAAFIRKRDFDVSVYLSKGFEQQHGEKPTRVRIWFSAYQSRWIRERRYHGTQESEEQPDGSIIVSFHAAGLEEMARWVLSFGSEAEVLEPDSLRHQVAREIERMQKKYARP